jgi:hypothetical protein
MNRAVGAGAVKGIAATQREVVKERGVGFFLFFLSCLPMVWMGEE